MRPQLGRLDKPLVEYTKADLNEQASTAKGCEEGCSVGCAFRCSLLDNDKPAFVKSVLKGYFRGTMFDNSRRKQAAPQARSRGSNDRRLGLPARVQVAKLLPDPRSQKNCPCLLRVLSYRQSVRPAFTL